MIFLWHKKSVFLRMRIAAAVLIIATFIFADFDTLLKFPLFPESEAVAVTIDSSASPVSPSHTIAQSNTVFVDDQTGYRFYRNGSGGTGTNGTCVYSKTTDGGASWGTEVLVDGQTDCEAVHVWYDRWTPGDTGDYIHISTLDSGNDDIWYNRLDTTSDTLLLGSSPVSAVLSQGSMSISAATANHSLTKSTDGDLFISVSDNADRFVVSCSASCNLSGSWSEVGDGTFMDADEDNTILLPLDSGEIMLINKDISANDIRSKIWDGASWDTSWSVIDSNAVENTTYDIQMSAVRSPLTGDVYLAYIADANNYSSADHDIRIAKYSSGLWSNLSDFVTNDTGGLTSLSLAIDENSDTVYLAYSRRSTIGSASTADVYWATSTAAATSWGSAQGPINSSSGDIFGVTMNYVSDRRIYASWFDADLDDVIGETVANVTPATIVSASGTQAVEVRASTTDVYVGGQFVIEENIGSRNVTNITISENGTVDAANDLSNVKILYDLDTTSPYDCASESFGGAESQFGATDTDGFSGADGTSTFSDTVNITTTQAMCLYVLFDVSGSASDGDLIDIEVSNPATDILVSGSVTAEPAETQSLTGSTTIANSDLTQTHFHWRNDDGNETGATSRTGGVEDTSLLAIQQEIPARLRFGVSNEGSTSSLATSLRLEYALKASTCELATGWTDVGAVDDDWNLSATANFADGDDTTDIGIGVGGVSNENSVFLTPNGGLRDSNSTLGSLTFGVTNWTEVEYSIVASTTATEGNTYCFRLSDAGSPLPSYSAYPEATIEADVTVTSLGSQAGSVDIPTDDFYIGGSFVITENASTRNVTGITITETGTIDASVDVSDIRLFYDLDTSAPYDCNSETYGGGESQFGSTAASFSSANGSTTFNDVLSISTTSTMCAYVVMDVGESGSNGETIDVTIAIASDDVVVSAAGSVSPSSVVDITGSSTLASALVTQSHYHWRNDDGSETLASSATGGAEDTVLEDHGVSSPIRLRIGLSNEGATSSSEASYGLEYGEKVSTCAAIVTWSEVGVGIDWDMYNSGNLTDGNDTTDIAVANGGVSDENSSFLSPNGGIVETDSYSASTTLTENQYVDLEYSIQSTIDTPYESEYCFRVTANGSPLPSYQQYAEVVIEAKRDFRVQRGSNLVSGTGLTLTAGVDYTAPSASTSAFVRIVNSHHTGSGRDAASIGNQNTDDYAAYILDPENIETSFTISRDTDSVSNTFVSWEIVEYIGPVGGDNEMVVRDQGVVSYGTTDTIATGTAVAGISDDADVAVFITGQLHTGGTRNEGYAHQSTAAWSASTDEPVLQRGATGANTGSVSYAVIEFTGLNWRVQRSEHEYTDVGTPQVESITAVNSLARTFLHTQKRYDGDISMANFGHEVWLSSIGAVSYQLVSSATTTGVTHTSVAWVIENLQTGTGEMFVQRSNGSSPTGGAEPLTITLPIATPINDTDNASIFANTALDSVGNQFPRVLAGFEIVSTSSYELWRSDTGNSVIYRTEVVQWPAADLAVRQNYYRFYVDNDALTPTDPWPAGAVDLGELTSITATDEPLIDGDTVRLRMSARVSNATLPADYLEVKLQYAPLVTTCTAVTVWSDVGAPASGEIWRGFNAAGVTDGDSLSGNPPTGGDLLLSVSNRAGRYVESGPAATNEFAVFEGEDIEYDWIIEHNGASQRTTYCFRMIRSDDSLLEGYFFYPELRTDGYTPVVDGWRWYDDETNETPLSPLAGFEVAPTNVEKGNAVKLRVTLDEIKNLPQTDASFKVQFAESPDFSDVQDVVSTSSCLANSVWCYYDGVDTDNDPITTALLAGSESCVGGVGAGCGSHKESDLYLTGIDHLGNEDKEYEFTLQYTNVPRKFGQVYYFRLYDLANDEVIAASSSDPSLAGESTALVFTVNGVDAETSVAGVTTDATSTATTIDFGSLPFNTDVEVAQEINVNTNATEGYSVYKYIDQQPTDSSGNTIDPISGTNAAPVSWIAGCPLMTTSCFGYHTTDATLENSSSRFSPTDSYAAASTSLSEIMFSSVPTNDTETIIYRMRVGVDQPAGDYVTNINYVAVPVF